MSRLSLEVVLELKSAPALAVWERLYSSHSRLLDSAGELEFYEKSCLARDVAKQIERGRRPHFDLGWEGRRLGYSHVTNSELSFVSIDGCVRDAEDAEAWLEPFLGGGFRQARLFDEEYDFWQNAADPLQYEARGRSYKGLPMRSNGLPPPVEQLVIDTSRNPGRRLLRRGFVEAVGCPMWLGETFWSTSGAKREVVCAERWLQCEVWRGDVVRVRPGGVPFTTAEGKAGELQEHLRRLLYPGRNTNPATDSR